MFFPIICIVVSLISTGDGVQFLKMEGLYIGSSYLAILEKDPSSVASSCIQQDFKIPSKRFALTESCVNNNLIPSTLYKYFLLKVVGIYLNLLLKALCETCFLTRNRQQIIQRGCAGLETDNLHVTKCSSTLGEEWNSDFFNSVLQIIKSRNDRCWQCVNPYLYPKTGSTQKQENAVSSCQTWIRESGLFVYI